jgi:hypothetical protein
MIADLTNGRNFTTFTKVLKKIFTKARSLQKDVVTMPRNKKPVLLLPVIAFPKGAFTQVAISNIVGKPTRALLKDLKLAGWTWKNWKYTISNFGSVGNREYFEALCLVGTDDETLVAHMERLNCFMSKTQANGLFRKTMGSDEDIPDDIPQGSRTMHRHHWRLKATLESGGVALRDGSKGVLIPAKVNIALGVISIALDITEKEVYDLYGPASRNFLATKRPHWVIAYHRKNVTYPAHQHTMLQMRKLRAKNRQLAQN